jgi:light-regulated signal transduction histidine kinase (bacteriophytochrome)
VALESCVNVALNALAARIEESNARIERQELPQVSGDRTLLTQLYQNLIGNALKFVAPGQRPQVELTARREGDSWILGVLDQGIGIDPEYAGQIFAPFRRLHARREYEGTGIGLAICRKAVERHGGRIWVDSQSGRGAHFQFSLKVDQENTSWEDSWAVAPWSSSSRMIPAIRN